MESVEVWMWLIAGLIIGSLIFVSGYTLLSHWIHNNEVNTALESFSLLKSSIQNVCSIGAERQEIESYVFPRIVHNITISDADYTMFEDGSALCMDMEGEPLHCDEMDREPNTCRHPITMENITFESDKGLFATLQKALGENKAVKLRFTISKKYDSVDGRYEILVLHKEEFIK